MDGEETEAGSGSWRGGMASAGAVLATILLIALMAMVTLSNRDRDQALASERHSYDVMLLTRTVDATMARAEAALGRYVLDEERRTGTLYYNEWVLAGRQIGELQRLVRRDPAQLARVRDLAALYEQRSGELAKAANAAATQKASGGISLFYQAGMTPRGPALRAKLADVADAERSDLRRRMAATGTSGEEATQLTEWLGWLAVLIGMVAIASGFAAFRAVSERLEAMRAADSQAVRARELELAVRERTVELSDANERLRREAAEREAAEAQLRQVQKMEAVGQLTGGIAHDFNNMLAVIVGGLDLARRKLSGSKREVEFHLDNAMEGATRAAALTRRLLAFARAEPLLPVGIVPANLIENMLDLVDRSIGERIVVETRMPRTPWFVRVDTNQLENAILNLAVNARDAMEGEGRIEIGVENVTLAEASDVLPRGDYVRISVSDTGCGIDAETIQRVFEPFFTTKPVGKGTGLGLSQIFGFARQSGGDVSVDSTPGVGTTVSLYLPRSLEAAQEAAVEQDSQAAPAPSFAGVTVLVVEDDPRVSRATVGALEELGYRPIPCSGGAEALEILVGNSEIELLLTDVMMPEMTGPELVQRALPLYPWLATLFVTGYVGDAGDADDLSGFAILRKPFTITALSDAVAAAVARRPSERRPASEAAAAE